MNIVCVPTPFGYGPAGKLATILNEMLNTDHSIYILCQDWQTKILSNIKSNKIYLCQYKPNDFENTIRLYLKKAHLMINVMDPRSARIASIYNVPVIGVDSLYWMWKEPDEIVYPAVKYFIQDFPGSTKIIKRWQHLFDKCEIVGPIVPNAVGTNNLQKKERVKSIVINIGGGLHNVFFTGQNISTMYTKGVLLPLIKAVKSAKLDTVLIGNNPDSTLNFKVLSKDKFNRLLMINKEIITTPGLTTFYEASQLDCSLRFILPENYSQYQNLTAFKSFGGMTDCVNWSDIYPELKLSVTMHEEKGLIHINQLIERLSKDMKTQEKLCVLFSEWLCKPCVNLSFQKLYLSKLLPPSAKYIATEIINYIRSIEKY